MPLSRDPNKLPSLLPFLAIAALLLVIYGGVLLFPTFKFVIDHQDCVATGRIDC